MKIMSLIALVLFSSSISASEKSEESEKQPAKTLLEELFNLEKSSICTTFPDCGDQAPGEGEDDELYYKELQNKNYKSLKSKSKKKPNNSN